jgi:hypothetical protein
MDTPVCSFGEMDLLEVAMKVIDALDTKQEVKELTDEEIKVREANTFSANRMKNNIEKYLKTRMGLNTFNSLIEMFKDEPRGFVKVEWAGATTFVNFYDGDDEDKEHPTVVSSMFRTKGCQYDYELDILKSILSHERFGEVILSIAGKAA